MSTFEETVQRIATDPVKMAAYAGGLPQVFTKTAGIARTATKNLSVAQKLLGEQGPQKVLGTAAGTALGGLLAFAGTSLHDKYIEMRHGHPDAYKEENKELGKLRARMNFKNQAVLQLEHEHKKVFTDLMKEDEILQSAPKGLVASSFDTMKKFAPHLASDINAARSFLRTSVESGSGPGFSTLKTLADSEAAVQSAGGMAIK